MLQRKGLRAVRCRFICGWGAAPTCTSAMTLVACIWVKMMEAEPPKSSYRIDRSRICAGYRAGGSAGAEG